MNCCFLILYLLFCQKQRCGFYEPKKVDEKPIHGKPCDKGKERSVKASDFSEKTLENQPYPIHSPKEECECDSKE